MNKALALKRGFYLFIYKSGLVFANMCVVTSSADSGIVDVANGPPDYRTTAEGALVLKIGQPSPRPLSQRSN